MMKIYTVAIILFLALGSTISAGYADSADSVSVGKALSSLPSVYPEKPSGKVSYRFTSDYYQYQPNGTFESKERVSSTYAEDHASGTAIWSGVTIANAKSFDEIFSTGEPQTYMDGFSYKKNATADSFKPGFFKGFPDTMESKSQVWDVGQLELFGTAFLKNLKLDVPYKPTLPDAPFPGGGSFHNTDAEITWIGVSKVHGKLCAQIEYEAPFNPLNFQTGGVKLNGLSYYHGLISVNLRDGQIERGTIKEEVVALVVPDNAPANFPPIVTHTIRDCVLERQ